MPDLTTPTPATSRRGFLAAAGLMTTGLLNATAADPPLAPPNQESPDTKMPAPPVKKLGWAIVGLGKLAIEEILPAFRLRKMSQPTALGSGHPDKARSLASVFNVDPKGIYSYTDYDKIIDNPAIDIVYIVLPNSMHAEYTIRALKAGKHVLCEKPMAPTVAECEQMITAAREAKRKLMIAYRLHYEPFNMTAIELCKSGKLGTLKLISASNGQNTQAPNIRLSKDLAGGPVGDVGVYCLNAARYLTREEPVEVSAMLHQPANDPRFKEVPESVAFTLHFPSGTIAHCDCSFGVAENRHFRVAGTTGVLEMQNAFGYQGQKLFLNTGNGPTELKLSPVDHFAAEMDHFSECVMLDKPCRTPGEEGLADTRVVTAILEAAKTGKSVKILR